VHAAPHAHVCCRIKRQLVLARIRAEVLNNKFFGSTVHRQPLCHDERGYGDIVKARRFHRPDRIFQALV
jgi:hypothetical protein